MVNFCFYFIQFFRIIIFVHFFFLIFPAFISSW